MSHLITFRELLYIAVAFGVALTWLLLVWLLIS